MPLILYECASPRFRHRPPNWIPKIKVTFKFISALKQWLAYTIFFATIPLHVRTHSSKNYSPISLHAFTLIFSTTLSMSTPRMRSQSIRSTLQLLHFILTTQLTFLKYFIPYFVFFLCNSKSLPQGRWHRTYKRVAGRERPTTRRRARGPRPPRSRPPRRGPLADPAFPGQSRRETAGATASY